MKTYMHTRDKNEIKKVLLEAYGDICFYCEAPLTLPEATIDHVLPIIAFPEHAEDASNYLISCKICNEMRSSMSFEHFCKYSQGEHYAQRYQKRLEKLMLAVD